MPSHCPPAPPSPRTRNSPPKPSPRSSPAAPPASRSPTSPARAASGPSSSPFPPASLIPRPDSETLIEAALVHFPDRTRPRRILDLGTGTGCLLLAALTEFPAAHGIGTDRAPAAARLAAHNAARLHLSPRAAFLAADWAAPLAPAAAARFDLILCNPPYIPAADIAALMPEVAAHEPRAALDGGADGLDAYATLLPTLPALLAPGGLACLELGAGQFEAASALARRAGFPHPTARHDLAGHDRALLLTQPR